MAAETLSPDPRRSASKAPSQELAGRFQRREFLAEGGMAKIWRFEDPVLARTLAVKEVHAGIGKEGRAQFIAEAKLQASLSHPSIVPIFDLIDAAGTPAITMQEVRGVTLAEALDAPPTLPGRSPWTRRALLEVLARICLAISYAHEHGVLHCDLKPENIMLGRFGEVYVLDWGIAVRTADKRRREMFGTPSYMSPEQGRSDQLDERSDVFALGAILFEVLSGEMLRFPSGEVKASELLALTQRDAHAGLRLDKLGAPLELALICARATATERDERTKSARQLHDELIGWLEGDRDTSRRKAEADQMVFLAQRRWAEGGSRADVLQLVSRAITLDPGNEAALAAMADLLLAENDAVSKGAERELKISLARRRASSARIGIATYAAWFGLLPVLILAGLKSVIALFFLIVPASVALGIFARAQMRGWTPSLLKAVVVASAATSAGLSGMFGPLLVIPGLLVSSSVSLLHLAGPSRALRNWVLGWGLSAFLLPLALEVFGLVPPSYDWVDGRLIVLPRLVLLSPTFTVGVLTVGGFLLLLANHFTVSTLVEQMTQTERNAVAQKHAVQDLLPDAMRAASLRSGE